MLPRTTSLKAEIALAVGAIVLCAVALDWVIMERVVERAFADLEASEARRDMGRAVNALEAEIETLDALAYDWAAWDDTYAFVADRNPEFIRSNLIPETLTVYGLNLLHIYDRAGNLVWGRAQDRESAEEITLGGFPDSAGAPAAHPLLAGVGDDGLAGLYLAGDRPVLVAARAILTSNDEGPARGTLIMGRVLDDDALATLSARTDLTLRAWTIGPALSPGLRAKVRPGASATEHDTDGATDGGADEDAAAARERYPIQAIDGGPLFVFATLPDISGRPALLLRATLARTITARGAEAVNIALASLVIAGLVVVAALMWLLHRLVVGPVGALTRHVLAVGDSGELSSRIEPARGDEIGVLAREFNRLLERLAETRRRLLEASYQAGMAGMAEAILHNIGNALNGVLVRVGRLRETDDDTTLARLVEAAEALAAAPLPAHERKLAAYLVLASRRLAQAQESRARDLAAVIAQTTEIERVLAHHGEIGRTRRLIEPVPLAPLIDEALVLVPADLRAAARVRIDRSVATVPPLRGQRVVLAHVLANLLTNAAESIVRSGRQHGSIEIRAACEEGGARPMVHVRVSDNGAGIDSDSLAAIFGRERSSKGRAHGFGLHWCANIVAGLDGRLYAESRGDDEGATLHLVLPAAMDAEIGAAAGGEGAAPEADAAPPVPLNREAGERK